MSAPVRIVDGSGTTITAKVSDIGELVTSGYSYEEASNALLDVVDTAYNFFIPKPSQQFVITTIMVRANKLVSAVSDATVDIYEANSASSTTISKSLFQTQIVESQIITLTNIRLLVTEGLFVNAKTDDDDITVNMLGYYIPIRKTDDTG
jgi:hypothetical protein